MCWYKSPRKSSLDPVFQQSQMARMARIISRMRGAGCDHGMENRRVMWGLIWLPSPRMKRPAERWLIVIADCAISTG